MIQWNATAFNDLGLIETTLAAAGSGIAEVIYEQQSGEAMILYSENNQSSLRYLTWDGLSLSAEGQLPSFGGEVYVIRAAADRASDQIFVAGLDKFFDLNVAVWDGNAWIDTREIDISVSYTSRS